MARRTPDLTLDAVAPTDEAALREWFEMERATQATDHPDDPPPCWFSHRARLSAPWDGEQVRAWLARCDTAVVGYAELALPQRDNTDNATCDVLVAPAHRRRGVGTALLALVADEARAARRVRMIGEARAPLAGSSPGWEFATAAGAREALVDVRRRLRLPGEHEDARARAAAQAAGASPGYDLVHWTAATPDEWVEDIARLTARMSTDAPLGDLHWAPEVHDAQRVRQRDAMCRARGISRTVTAARAPDGSLAAFTEISVETSTEWFAATWNTLVQPEHRGRRLGMRVKLANLALVRQRFPRVRVVDTYNAASNTHMIAINEAIGFRAHDRVGEWELEL